MISNVLASGGCEQKVYDGVPQYILDAYPGFQGQRILDVGCGSGGLGGALQAMGNACYGNTLSPKEAEAAKSRLTQVIVADLDAMRELPFPENFFDVVIFADVLEHLKDPKHLLKLMRPHLKSGGLVIASIPNVANIVVRLNLLRGRFEYGELGILDNTHLRFFTLGTAKDLLTSTGYWIQDVKFTDWNWNFPGWIQWILKTLDYEWEIRQRLTRWWPGLFSTQFVLRAALADRPILEMKNANG